MSAAALLATTLITPQWPYALAALLFAAGMWLLYRGAARASPRGLGAGVCLAGSRYSPCSFTAAWSSLAARNRAM